MQFTVNELKHAKTQVWSVKFDFQHTSPTFRVRVCMFVYMLSVYVCLKAGHSRLHGRCSSLKGEHIFLGEPVIIFCN